MAADIHMRKSLAESTWFNDFGEYMVLVVHLMWPLLQFQSLATPWGDHVIFLDIQAALDF